ncbi:MAG: type II toxin-antitoxin system Phd/YefM family antitoxin [Pseudobdellovibrionaceae bacterium]
MRKIKSTEAKTKFGEVITTSQREPVVIEKNGKNVSVVISFEEFKNYQETVLADRYWGEQALQAKMVGKKKSKEFIDSFGND